MVKGGPLVQFSKNITENFLLGVWEIFDAFGIFWVADHEYGVTFHKLYFLCSDIWSINFASLKSRVPPWPTRKFLCQIFELFLECLVHFNMGITNTIFILHRFWPELNNWGKTILAGNSKARSKFWPFFLKWRNFFGNFYYYRPCL